MIYARLAIALGIALVISSVVAYIFILRADNVSLGDQAAASQARANQLQSDVTAEQRAVAALQELARRTDSILLDRERQRSAAIKQAEALHAQLHDLESQPATRAWLDEPVPAAVADLVRGHPAGADPGRPAGADPPAGQPAAGNASAGAAAADQPRPGR